MKRVLGFGLVIGCVFLMGGCSDTKSGDTAASQIKSVGPQTPQEEEKSVVVQESVVEKQEIVSQAQQSHTPEPVATEESPAPLTSKSGSELYRACSSCHGSNGQKAALGKSALIGGWEESKTMQALEGYKNGTYGGAMKSVMVGQVAKLSQEDMQKLSQYIQMLQK